VPMTGQEIIGVLISLTALASYINHCYVKLPPSIGLTLITFVLSLIIAASSHLGWDVDVMAQTLLQGVGFNETFLHGMLSFLLFAGSLHVNTRELAKHKVIVALLATVSVALSTFLVGMGTFVLTQFLEIELPFYYCLVFGALISPTDPIAVLGILKKVKAPKSLEMKIAGEALFNDGMGIVLFVILLGLATGSEDSWTPSEVMLFFAQQGLGGICLGAFLGWGSARLLRSIDTYEVAILVTLAVVTGGYTLAHSMAQVSGAICMVVAGMVVGSSIRHGRMSAEALERLDSFWELLDGVLNAMLFVLIGLEFVTLNFSFEIIFASIGAIGIAMAARWISVAVPVASLAAFRKFSPNVVMIMTWGGLRGGISIALALAIPVGPYRELIVSITYAVVLFSIVVQGLTVGALVKKVVMAEGEEVLPTAETIVELPSP